MVALGAPTLLFLSMCLRDTRAEQRFIANSDVVDAHIGAGWDGGINTPVVFKDPTTGRQREASVELDNEDVPKTRSATIAIRVARPPATGVGLVPYGDRERWWTFFLWAMPAVGAPVLLAIARWRRLRRSRRLMSSSTPTYRMVGVARPGWLFRDRLHLDLFELDAAPGDPALCSLPLADRPADTGRPRLVEVKGAPRPAGEMVVRDVATGAIWWPASRALVGSRGVLPAESPSTLPPPPPPPTSGWSTSAAGWSTPATGWPLQPGGGDPVGLRRAKAKRSRNGRAVALVAVGVALVFASYLGVDLSETPEGAVPATATTVDAVPAGRHQAEIITTVQGKAVRFKAPLVGPLPAGTTLTGRIDPTDPSRWWPSEGDPSSSMPPPWSTPLLYGGCVVVGVGLVAALSGRRTRGR